jgi:hypothetical protein
MGKIEINLTAKKEAKCLDQTEVYESHKTLGAHKCIYGKEVDQYNILLEKSNKLIILAEKGQINRRQAWMAYSCLYIPSMVFCLTAVSMEEQ